MNFQNKIQGYSRVFKERGSPGYSTRAEIVARKRSSFPLLGGNANLVDLISKKGAEFKFTKFALLNPAVFA